MTTSQLQGKRALVTGGAQRIGKAFVQALQRAGVEVVVHYNHSQKEAEALSPFTVQADLHNIESVSQLFESLPPVDFLINNASVFSRKSLPDSSLETVQREFAINLFAPIELTRQFVKQTKTGVVINLLDQRITSTDLSCAAYSLSKKSLADFTRFAALEYAPDIRVNAIAPGPILPPVGTHELKDHFLIQPPPPEIYTPTLFSIFFPLKA